MICTQEDSYIRDRFESQPRWIVTLNDGRKVYQDDDRPGLEPSAWLRLQQYIYENAVQTVCYRFNSVFITGMYLQFRSHIEHLPSNMDGYFFCKGMTAFMAGPTVGTYNTGYLSGDKVIVTKWRIPELISIGDDIRDVEKCQKFLILSKNI